MQYVLSLFCKDETLQSENKKLVSLDSGSCRTNFERGRKSSLKRGGEDEQGGPLIGNSGEPMQFCATSDQ